MAESVGLIGAGLLGSALAQRLLNAGYRICAFDPDPSARKRIQVMGGDAADGVTDVARRCRRLLLSLPGPAEVAEVVNQIGVQMRSGSVVVDTTTGDPDAVETAAAHLAADGIEYLDAEIGGSSVQALNGQAIVLCGGSDRGFSEAFDLLQAISLRVYHTGPPGTGTRMKLALNIAIGLHRAVLAESLEFARACGIDPALALKVLRAGPGYSAAMDVKGDKMLSGDFTPQARLSQHLKDVRLILATGAKSGARLPLSSLHEQLLQEAEDRGYGGDDNCGIIRIFRTAEAAGGSNQ